MASAAKEAGVQHFIWSTLVNCEEKSGGKYKVPHLSGKARVDPVVRALGFKHHTFIVLAFYFQNFVDAGFSRVDADGAVVFDLPMEAQHILQACDVHDTGAAVLAAFQDPQAWQEEEYMNLCGFHGLVQTYLDLFTKSTGHRARLNTLAEIKDEKVGKEWTDVRLKQTLLSLAGALFVRLGTSGTGQYSSTTGCFLSLCLVNCVLV